MMDSITAVSYVREQGGSKSTACNKIARKIWLWAYSRQIWISSEHLVGALNVTVDFESRNFQKETEWMLDRFIFQKINSKLGFKPDIDLFANRVNFQLPRFVSWKPQPGCFAVNAFSLNWQNLKPYCFPPFQNITKGTSENFARRSHSNSDHTELANTGVLCNSDQHAHRQSYLREKTQKTITAAKSAGRNPHYLEQTGPSGVPVIRQSIARQGLSKEASDIIIAGWRRTTSKQYQTYLRKWEIYCSKWEIDPLCAPLNRILEFLTQLFDNNLGYSGINTAKSALSSVVSISDSNYSCVGKHPLIKRFMRGVFNLRPSMPRYTETFDAAKVLNYLRQIDIKDISLKQITLKTTMLLALLSGQRVQTLKALSVQNVKYYDNKV